MERNHESWGDLEELIKKAREFDEIALATLTRKYHPIIFRYFYYRTKTKEDAEDLASDVFVRVVSSIKSQKGDFTAWLFRIARNLLIDYYRKKGRLKEMSLDEMNVESFSVLNRDNPNTFYPEEIKKMFRFLTDEQKEVITLKFFEGYSTEEIAKIMDKSTGAIKALQFRALSVLKDVVKKETQ